MTSPAADYVAAFEREVGAVDPAYEPAELKRISTGMVSLDLALGGGIPAGHITEIIGVADSHKSTLALNILAENRGGVYVDVDGHFDPAYAARIGADPCLANTVEMDAIHAVVCEMLFHGETVVVDSLASMVTPDDMPLGWCLGTLVHVWHRLVDQLGGTLVLVDQLRHRSGMGSWEVTVGGGQISARSSLRLCMVPSTDRVQVQVVRDLHHPGYRAVWLDTEPYYGLSRVGAWLDAALACGEIVQSGSWYAWPDGRTIAQGREETKEALRDRC
jgi:recombination protein RecA